MFECTFPLNHSPTIKIIGSHFREHSAKIDLSIAQRAETSGTIDPALIATIDALTSGWIELGIFDVEHLDPVFIDVDIVEVIQTLQHIMRRIIEHIGARMVFDTLQKHFERHAIMQVFARMDFIANIDAMLVGMVKDRRPAASEFIECRFNQTGRALGPWIDERPCQSA